MGLKLLMLSHTLLLLPFCCLWTTRMELVSLVGAAQGVVPVFCACVL